MTRTRPRTRFRRRRRRRRAIVVVALRTIDLQTVVTPSMEPELRVGDRVLVNQLVPAILPLQRGDIAVFEDPGGWAEASARSRGQIASGAQIVKRVIGVAGDRVACCSPEGDLLLNGRRLDGAVRVRAAASRSRST